MNDKELLKFAAKAAGMYPQDFQLDDDEQIFYEKRRGISLAWGVGWWNPLTDDGAALRLAVKLKIIPACDDIQASAMASLDKSSWCTLEEVNGDRYSATRRAIVRAAAEIGKSL
jgi:hypothetical protein